jgi:uncharacterized tellurite resistance protein B-like protein
VTYQGAALLLHFAAVVATADGEVTESEERHLAEHLERALHLSLGERTRLRAHLSWLLDEPPTLAGIKNRVATLGEDRRASLGGFLISLAAADGLLGADEIKVLTKIYGLLGLEPQTIYSNLHQLMSAAEPAAAEPVTMRPAQAPREAFQIPPPLGAAGAESVIRLDLAKVREKLAETSRVSDLLSGIFLDEETAKPTVSPAPLATEDDFAIAGLDSAHSALLLRLAGSASWERIQVERLAAALGLLPDGALEIINEAAFLRCGAPLIEGDERVEIDDQILREMMS